jgi:hypothetical protein
MSNITELTRDIETLGIESGEVADLGVKMKRCKIAWTKKDKREWARVKRPCKICGKYVRRGDMSSHLKTKKCRLVKRRLKAAFKKMEREAPDRVRKKKKTPPPPKLPKVHLPPKRRKTRP